MKIPFSALGLWITRVSLSILIGGCVAPTEPPLAPSSAVFTPTHTATNTQRTTPTPSPTSTTSPTTTPQPTPTPTSTPLPTLSADQAQALMLDLFRNNAGCRLPCWWGITPGQTSWETAQRLLATFASGIELGSSAEHHFYTVYLVVPAEIYPYKIEFYPVLTQDYDVIDGTVEVIQVEPGLVPNYDLSEFLKTYGSPAEIWLRTYNQAREGDLPFDVVLFYPEQGILARYATQAKAVGRRIRGCPQQRPAAILALWSPERKLTFSEATSQTTDIRNEDWWPYRPLQEATGMDVETFYQTFKNSTNSICLETPAELWPQP